MKLRPTLRALRDLDDVANDIQAENPSAARRVKEEFQKAFQLLAVHPHAGRAMAGGRRRLVLRRFPYLIYYRVDEVAELVLIITVRHAARERVL